MAHKSRHAAASWMLLGLVFSLGVAAPSRGQDRVNFSTFDTPDATGTLRTVTRDGTPFDLANPFFQSLGRNGRSCASCHVPSSGWTTTPADVQLRFNLTAGLDPIFRTVDGSNSPLANVSTVAKRRVAYSLLLSKGLIREGQTIPKGAEYRLIAVDDPYKFASVFELSFFRRPLPITNLRFLTTLQWDGRESFAGFDRLPILTTNTPAQNAAVLFADLTQQASDAILVHTQPAHPLTTEQAMAIANFELNLATAQQTDSQAGSLSAPGVLGGPADLVTQSFYVSINDALGADITGAPFVANSMTLFQTWLTSSNPRQASIARGAKLFGSRTIPITGVGGLNDTLKRPVIFGTCTTCHDTPNVGNHSVELLLHVGVSDEQFRTPDLPLYTFKNITTGATVKTTDPGRAILTGKWADMGKFKVPVLRGLAARPPYFHNGFAADLHAVVEFYMTRFNFVYTDQEEADLVAFLQSL